MAADLYRDICRNPEDMTARLAYADYLDERPTVRITCAHCRADESVQRCHRCHQAVNDSHEHRGGEDYDGTWFCTSSETCPQCDDVGTVVDTSAADLAEFIRLQCRLHEWPFRQNPDAYSTSLALRPRCGNHWCRKLELCSRCLEWVKAVVRQDDLLGEHLEWSKCSCVACEGRGWVMVDTSVDLPAMGDAAGGRLHRQENCDVCSGTGDLFRQRRPHPDFGSLALLDSSRNVSFARGLPASIDCRLNDVGYLVCSECGGVETLGEGEVLDHCSCLLPKPLSVFVPSSWAVAVVRQTPITTFMLLDKSPRFSSSSSYNWYWLFNDGGNYPFELPACIFAEIPENGPDAEHNTYGRYYLTDYEARLDAGNAVGRLVRKSVYGVCPPGGWCGRRLREIRSEAL